MSNKPEQFVALVGNLSEGFVVIGPFESFDDAAEAVTGRDSWIMTLRNADHYKDRR